MRLRLRRRDEDRDQGGDEGSAKLKALSKMKAKKMTARRQLDEEDNGSTSQTR